MIHLLKHHKGVIGEEWAVIWHILERGKMQKGFGDSLECLRVNAIILKRISIT